MARSPTKSTISKRSVNPPGKTIIRKTKPQNSQRRFSLVDSDSSELSEFESGDEPNDEPHDSHTGKFQAFQTDSEESDSHEELWKSHADQVVNTSSDDDEEEDDDSSSSDDDEDYVKLTAERKAKAAERHRSSSPFKSPPPPQNDVDFSFDWNNGDHQLKIQDEEEDVGEELSMLAPPLRKEIPITGEPLGFVNIEDSGSDEDIDKDELLRTLAQESDAADEGIETGEDDYNLLQEEANNILQDYSNGDLQLSTQTTPRNSVVEDMIRKFRKEADHNEALQYVSDDDDEYYDDDDDEDDDSFVIPFFDDSVFKDRLLYTSEGAMSSQNKAKSVDSDDDSYLWNYFFSGGEDSEDGAENHSDDEATDEDTTLPPPSSGKSAGSKAQELLSSSSIIARPPALGTWSTDSKPFGIIDGLSTRSLHPAQSNTDKLPVIPMGIASTNAEEFTLDELLNMSELEDDDSDQGLDHQQWLEFTSSARKVPLSAFRNKGVVNEDMHLNATRRFSNGGGPKLKPKRIRNDVMTPLTKAERKNRNSKLKIKQAEAANEGLRVTRSGLFSEESLGNVEEFLSGLGNEAELTLLFREVQ